MIEAGKDIQKPFCQAVSEDLVSGHDIKNFVGSFVYELGPYHIAYLYAVYGPAKIDIADDWNGIYKIDIDSSTVFKFPVKIHPAGAIQVETNENTLTQILIKDEY